MHTVFEGENLTEYSNFILSSSDGLKDAIELTGPRDENEDNFMQYNIENSLTKNVEDRRGEVKGKSESSTEGESNENKEYRYGVSEPITLNTPSKEDFKRTNDVVELLKGYNLFETEYGLKKREKVLGMINKIFHEFIMEICLHQGMNEEEAKEINGNLYTFGSYRLGVITPNSDMDCIFLAPQNFTREIFFNEFYSKLKQDRNVKKLQALPETYTPIIKFMYDGVDIDLLLATVPYRTLKDCQYSLDNDNIMKNLDEITVRSLNGIRVADLILSSVPNKEYFRNTLRFIKLWAKNRGIYSNILGFLGGISWALLTARICQLYPNYTTSQLICRFFRIYSIWNWNYPVLLRKIKKYATEGLREFPIWDPEKNIKDKFHVMPIITPAFPSMNSTHNVTYCTRSILIEEFRRAYLISQTVNKQNEMETTKTNENPNVKVDGNKEETTVSKEGEGEERKGVEKNNTQEENNKMNINQDKEINNEQNQVQNNTNEDHIINNMLNNNKNNNISNSSGSNSSSSSSSVWNKILEPIDIINQYNHFLHIQIMAINELTHNKWKGWIESKVRLLFKKLENINKLKIRPYPKFYLYKDGEYSYCSSFFIALQLFPRNSNDRIFDLSSAIYEFIEIVKNWPDKEKFPNAHKLNIFYQKRKEVMKFLDARNNLVQPKIQGQGSESNEKIESNGLNYQNVNESEDKKKLELKNAEEIKLESNGKEQLKQTNKKEYIHANGDDATIYGKNDRVTPRSEGISLNVKKRSMDTDLERRRKKM